jgi:hypothetical protein
MTMVNFYECIHEWIQRYFLEKLSNSEPYKINRSNSYNNSDWTFLCKHYSAYGCGSIVFLPVGVCLLLALPTQFAP